MFLLLPFNSLIVNLLGISLTVLFTLLLVFIIVPAIFGVSFGIRRVYMKTLLKIFRVSHASGTHWTGASGPWTTVRLPGGDPLWGMCLRVGESLPLEGGAVGW